MPNGDDLKIRVGMDTKEAKKKTEDMMSDWEKFRDKLGKRLQQSGKAGFAGLAIGLGAPAAGDFFQTMKTASGVAGRALSRTVGLEQLAATFQPRVTAQERTIQAFGLAGANASKEQIESVFKAFQRIEEMRTKAALRVREVTDPNVASAGEIAKLTAALVALNVLLIKFGKSLRVQ